MILAEETDMLEKKSARLEELMPLIREELERDRSVRIYPRGTSMLPMLREGKDSVVLSKIPDLPRKYDVVLYKRANGQYVLHRLVRVGEKYTFLGDNQFDHEYGIEQSQMIAYVSSFYRGKREKSVENIFYKIYCRLWYCTRGVRSFWRRGTNWLRRALRGNSNSKQ